MFISSDFYGELIILTIHGPKRPLWLEIEDEIVKRKYCKLKILRSASRYSIVLKE